MGDIEKIKGEKETLERQKKKLEKDLNQQKDSGAKSTAAASDSELAQKQKKIIELTEQIKIYKAELADKQKEFQHERQELQKVIEEQKLQLQKGDTPDVEKIRKELEKAQKEVKEGAVERERCQSQLEILIQELEQKQMDLHEANYDYPPPVGLVHLEVDL